MSMFTIRHHHPSSRAHIATWRGDGWGSVCPTLWDGTEWLKPDMDVLVSKPDWRGLGGGRPMTLELLNELPLKVKVCTRCISRVLHDAAELKRAMAVRA